MVVFQGITDEPLTVSLFTMLVPNFIIKMLKNAKPEIFFNKIKLNFKIYSIINKIYNFISKSC